VTQVALLTGRQKLRPSIGESHRRPGALWRRQLCSLHQTGEGLSAVADGQGDGEAGVKASGSGRSVEAELEPFVRNAPRGTAVDVGFGDGVTRSDS